MNFRGQVCAAEPCGHQRLQIIREGIIAGIVPPIGRVISLVQAVMRNDIIANALYSAGHGGVELISTLIRRSTSFEGGDKSFHRGLDDVKRSSLQWFNESLRQTNRKAIADPAARQTTDMHL